MVFHSSPWLQIVMTNFASSRNFSDIISQLNLRELVQLCKLRVGHLGGEGYCVQAWLQGIMDWEAGTSRDPHFNPQNPWYDRAGGGKWDLTWSRILGPAGKTLLDPTQLEQVESTLNWTSDLVNLKKFLSTLPKLYMFLSALYFITPMSTESVNFFQLQIAVVAKLVWLSDVAHHLKWRHRLYIVISTPNLQIRHFSLLQVHIVILSY